MTARELALRMVLMDCLVQVLTLYLMPPYLQ